MGNENWNQKRKRDLPWIEMEKRGATRDKLGLEKGGAWTSSSKHGQVKQDQCFFNVIYNWHLANKYLFYYF